MTAIGVHARDWGFRHAGRRDWALRGLDLAIAPGERVLLAGSSGAGKSTLLAAIAGLLDPDHSGEQQGRLDVDGHAALMFQDPETQLVMARAGDDVAFGLENYAVPPREIWPRVDEALRAVGFPYDREQPTGWLSGGEKQRLVLAGVLALRPGLLLLDEPTANLDPDGAALVRDAVRQLLAHTDTTLIVVEHRSAEWLDIVDRMVVLQPGGGVRSDGKPVPPATAAAPRHSIQPVGLPPPTDPAGADPDGGADTGRGRGSIQPVGLPPPTDPAGADPDGGADTGRGRGSIQPVGLPPLTNPGDGRHSIQPVGLPLLTGTGLSYRYPGTDRTVVDDANVELRAGEALAITGPNGSGKSTLALLLAGLLKPASGASYVDGEPTPLHRLRAERLVRKVGSVFQDPEHQFLTSTVTDELALGPRRVGLPEPEVRQRVDDLLERLRLDKLAGANPFTLSGGEKRRLSVATALATEPAVLVLDEPTFGQDQHTWLEMRELLADLRDAGHAVCCVSHDRPFVEALADRELRL